VGIRVGFNWPRIISCDWYFVVCFTTLAVSVAETLASGNSYGTEVGG
jgi:hypothetical protein